MKEGKKTIPKHESKFGITLVQEESQGYKIMINIIKSFWTVLDMYIKSLYHADFLTGFLSDF